MAPSQICPTRSYADMLRASGNTYEVKVVSASPQSPDLLFQYAEEAGRPEVLKWIIIAGAAGAAAP